jgi:hypothetical protein
VFTLSQLASPRSRQKLQSYNIKRTYIKFEISNGPTYVVFYAVFVELRQRSRYSYWLRAGRPRGRSSSSVGQEFSLRHVVHTDSGAHPASNPMDRGASFPDGKAAGA